MKPRTAYFKRSKETEAIVDLFLKTGPGEIATYAAIARASGVRGFDPRGADKDHVRVARFVMLREHGRVFKAVALVGIRHLTDEDVVTDESGKGQERIRRQARRSGRELDTVKSPAGLGLPDSQVYEFQARRQLLAFVEQQTAATTVKRAERRAVERGGVIDPKDFLDVR